MFNFVRYFTGVSVLSYIFFIVYLRSPLNFNIKKQNKVIAGKYFIPCYHLLFYY